MFDQMNKIYLSQHLLQVKWRLDEQQSEIKGKFYI